MKRLVWGVCVSASLHALVLVALLPSSVNPPRFDVRSGSSSVEMVFAASTQPTPRPTKTQTPEDPRRPEPEGSPAPSDDVQDSAETESVPETPQASAKTKADTSAEPDSPSSSGASEPSPSASSSVPRAARDAGVRWVQDVAYRRNPPPRYPTKARVYGEEGTVRLLVTIGPDGHPRRVDVHESSGHYRLDRAARKAVRRWEFVPARKDGEPVTSQTLVPVSFELDR